MKRGRDERSEQDFLIDHIHFKIHHKVNLLTYHKVSCFRSGKSVQEQIAD